MALFGGGKETNEEKELRQLSELLDKYGLRELSDPEDKEAVKKIAQDLIHSGFYKNTKFILSADEVANLVHLSAIVEQNWIIIKLLDKIAKS